MSKVIEKNQIPYIRNPTIDSNFFNLFHSMTCFEFIYLMTLSSGLLLRKAVAFIKIDYGQGSKELCVYSLNILGWNK